MVSSSGRVAGPAARGPSFPQIGAAHNPPRGRPAAASPCRRPGGREEDGQSVSALGSRLHLDSGTLAPLLKRMGTGGLLQRRRGHDDERPVTVHLAEAGTRLHEGPEHAPQAFIDLLAGASSGKMVVRL